MGSSAHLAALLVGGQALLQLALAGREGLALLRELLQGCKAGRIVREDHRATPGQHPRPGEGSDSCHRVHVVNNSNSIVAEGHSKSGQSKR